MGLHRFFHKIKVSIERMTEPPIPEQTEAENYGYSGESEFIKAIKFHLPGSKIKNNIIIQTPEGNAEIDCLILYKNKLFAIEIKSWKGKLVERGGDFVQYKRDRWTDEIHTKIHKSPFKQLGRAVYLLRKQIPDNAWLNTIVFFEESDCIESESDNVWFDSTVKLVAYIVNDGKASPGDNASAFFDKCIAADCLYYDSCQKHCIVCEDSLVFYAPTARLDKSKIRYISITHHLSYDELNIMARNGIRHKVKTERKYIYTIENGLKCRYALCNLDHIQIGN